MSSYYKTIRGVRYDRELLDIAEKLVTGNRDGRISQDDASTLWEEAQDGQGVTVTEKRTLQYILDHYNCEAAASAYLNARLNPSQAHAEPEPEEPLSPRTAARQAKRNNFVSALGVVVCVSVAVIYIYDYFRDPEPDAKQLAISTVLISALTAVVINPGYWTLFTQKLCVIPSLKQFCGIAACWTGVLAVVCISAPELVIQSCWTGHNEDDASQHLVAEAGRLLFLATLLMLAAATRKFHPGDALGLFLLGSQAKPCASLAHMIKDEGDDPVEGMSVSLFLVLFALLVFGVYAYIINNRWKFVAAGAIATSIYGCYLLFDPERFVLDTFNDVKIVTPVMHHYATAFGLSLISTAVLLTYTALDDQQRGGEVFSVMGFCASTAVSFIVFSYEHTVGSLADQSFQYKPNCCLGLACLLVLVMGMLSIANAAAPHPKIVFVRATVTKYLLRALYISSFVLSFLVLKYPTQVKEFSGLDKMSDPITLWMVVGHLTLAALYSAAAQLNSASQRKVVQYSMAMPLVVFVLFFANMDIMQELISCKHKLIAFHVANGFLLFTMLFACYYTKRSKHHDQDCPESAARTNTCRLLYVQAIYFGAQMLYTGPPAITGASPDSAEWKMHALIDLMIGMVYVAAAQVDSVSQKKMLQYGMVGTMASIIVSIQMYGFAPSVLALQAVNLIAAVYACYM